jgi:predicted ATPase
MFTRDSLCAVRHASIKIHIMLKTLAVANYRSLHGLIMPLGNLNVVTGANGSGKSNLYRALRLLAETAQGGVAAALAKEGGLSSALWAGPETISRAARKGEQVIQGGPRKDVIQLRLGFAGDDFGYAIDLGLPQRTSSAFAHDPEIKRECIWAAPLYRPASLLVDRHGAMVRVRAGKGNWDVVSQHLARYDSMLTQLADPVRTPEVLTLREQIRSWRFYDHFRTDADAPARRPQIGTHTPVMHHDGHDLAAALQTIREIGDAQALDDAISDAFPGATLNVNHNNGRFEIEIQQHGLLRPLAAGELSDGTLRYLLLTAALLSPRAPELMVLNEPETSLHPDLLPALARLIAKASEASQLWVVSHAPGLVRELTYQRGCNAIMLDKNLGETTIADQAPLDVPPWQWPAR